MCEGLFSNPQRINPLTRFTALAGKKELRQQLRSILAEIPARERAEKSLKACQRLFSLPKYSRAEVVMVFLSMPGEVDTAPLVLRAWQDGKRVLAPKVSWEQRRMIPVEIGSLTSDVKLSSLGVREPTSGVPIPVALIDIVIVPGLGFDDQGNRLGRGRGFYDRFLAHPDFRGVSCAIAFEEQFATSIPVDSLDRRVDMVITDKKVRKFS